MNSLNILSARVSPPQTPAPSRSNSYGNALSLAGATETRRVSKENAGNEKAVEEDELRTKLLNNDDNADDLNVDVGEKTLLLERCPTTVDAKISQFSIPHRIVS